MEQFLLSFQSEQRTPELKPDTLRQSNLEFRLKLGRIMLKG